MPLHVVKQGEHITRIAREYGLVKPELIWDHPQNANLKKQRQNMNVLFPGDQVFVPEFEEKEDARATGKLHQFQVERSPLKLVLKIRDESEKPLTATPCRLNVQGKLVDKTTDGEGRIEEPIDPLAEDAMLDIAGVQVPIKIGHLDPVDQRSGQQARLNNLGYDAGPIGGADEQRFLSAVEEFQCDAGIKPVTGVCDGATQTKLKEVHGC
jgi:hypothetical protein